MGREVSEQVSDPIRAILTLKNNRLIRLREERGMSQRKVSDDAGINLMAIGGYETMRVRPTSGEDWKPTAVRLAHFYGVSPRYLWPDVVQSIEERTISRTISEDEVAAISAGFQPEPLALPDEVAGERELRAAVIAAIKRLPDRERVVVEGQMDGRTLEDIGSELNISRSRTMQIGNRARAHLHDELTRRHGNDLLEA